MDEKERGGDAAPTNGKRKLPVIDMSCDEKSAAAALRHACINYGFFYVVNHGVSEELIQEMFRQSKLFFALPLESKLECVANSTLKGYHGFGEEKTDPVKQKAGGTKECYDFGPERSAEEAIATPDRPFHMPNAWPDETSAPLFRRTVVAYFQAVCAAGMRLLRVIALALDMEPEFFDRYYTDPMATGRLLHYDGTVSDPAAGLYACGEHTDYGFVTFLTTDGVPGLQIQWPDGAWVDVEAVDGAFIVNIADMLERWTNGLFRSTRHRVLNTSGQERYSIPLFFDTDFDSTIECLPTCCSADNPPKYDPVVSGKWLFERLQATYPTTE